MPTSLKDRALRWQAQREHSRQELARKLAPHGADDEIALLLDHMEELGLLSDTRFAEAYVRGHATRFGAQRLRMELARRGVDADTIVGALQSELQDGHQTEVQRARDVWQRKFGTPPADAREWARQSRFMLSRGFASELVRKLLKDPIDESA